jgi:2OG-Fe(II) oxygenase superfamily
MTHSSDLTWHTSQVSSLAHFMTPAECRALVALAQSAGFVSAPVRTVGGPVAMPAIRNNDRCIIESPDWVALIWQRLQALGLPILEGQRPIGLPRELRFYQYREGQRFKMHKDGPWKENGQISKLTLLIYLNEGFIGGETNFRTFDLAPTTGLLCLFEHAIWHEGVAVSSGTKFVLRSDVLYAAVDPGLR